MSDCVNIEWKNGFGNQLFQYAYGRILSNQMNCSLTYSGTLERWKGTSLIDMGFLNNDHIKKHTNENIRVNIDYNKNQAFDLEDPKNYEPYLDQIKSWFPKVKNFNVGNDLVVHVRIGDNGPNIYTPFEWYKKAIDDNKIEFDKMYVVTDTPNDKTIHSLKSYYNAELISHVNIETIGDRKKYKNYVLVDFDFIRGFDKILFSNSTFSWWASLLSEASNIWFNKEWQPNHYNGRVKLGNTNYKNWHGIIPFSLKD